MGQPYVGEIRMFGGNFAPAGWYMCDGQLLPISENETLFNLIGTMYGGDGETTFALPDLRGRVPVHQGRSTGSTYVVAEEGGVESVTLTVSQIPTHTHPRWASAKPAASASPVGTVPAKVASGTAWGTDNATVLTRTATAAGGSQPHENMQPFLAVSYIISAFGVFPSPT